MLWNRNREQMKTLRDLSMAAKTKFNRSAKNKIRKSSISKGKSHRLKIGKQRQRYSEQKHKVQHQKRVQ